MPSRATHHTTHNTTHNTQHNTHTPHTPHRRLTQTRVAFFFCVTVMFPNPADGLCADRAPGTVGAARRRRDRRLRAFLKHERLAAMNMATIHHHSFMKSAVVDVSVQVGSPFAPVTEYVALAPAVTLSVPSLQLRPAYTSATVAAGVNFDVTGFVNPQFFPYCCGRFCVTGR